MPIKCTAIIQKEYKTRKADSSWPMYAPTGTWIPTDFKGEICGGDVTVTAIAFDEPYYGGSSATLEIKEVCSRCKYPFYDGKEKLPLHDTMELDLTPMIEALQKQ